MTVTGLLEKRGRISWYAGLVLSILFMLTAVRYELSTPAQTGWMLAGKAVFIVAIFIGSFMMFYHSKGSVVRLVLFSAMALIFSVSFMSGFYLVRGHIGFTENDISAGIPFCHIAIINNILSLPVLRSFVNPSNLNEHFGIYPMILIWFWATVMIGKGWCSWGCFYGGWDSISSSVLKRPPMKISEVASRKLRYISYSLLAVVAVSSTLLFVPVFCSYICPFKTVTEFQQVTGFVSWIVFLVTVTIFIATCVILPLLFGKRIWCTYLCPFGAFQSLTGKIFRVFKVKIDPDKCISCGKCVGACKTCGITADSLAKYKSTSNCSLCGKCMETCPKEAIKVSIFGNTTSPKALVEKILMADETKSGYRIKNRISVFVGDMLHPVTLLYFFGLTVLFNFFTGFYFSMITNLETIVRSIING